MIKREGSILKFIYILATFYLISYIDVKIEISFLEVNQFSEKKWLTYSENMKKKLIVK